MIYTDAELSIMQEGLFAFKTPEDAEKALKKCKNDSDFKAWFGYICKTLLTPVIIVNGSIIVPIFHVLLTGFTNWLALPGSNAHKINRVKSALSSVNKSINKLEKEDSAESKKAIKEFKKLRDKMEDELKSLKGRQGELGKTMSNMREYACFSSPASYITHYALCESYITEKIESEERLAFAMKESMILSESDYSNIKVLQEAKLGDKIKVKWKQFIAFIKRLAAKFMESMTNLLLDEKDYLEKYKDIILKKEPKEDLEYSYTGDYNQGVNRIINTEIPLFEYEKYQKALEAEGDRALAEQILQGKGFTFDDGETLAEQFKSYYLVLDSGQKEGKLNQLNMKDIYNFCYNFSKIKSITEKDINRLEASTRNIETLITKKLGSTNTVQQDTSAGGENTGNATANSPKQGEGKKGTQESFLIEEENGQANKPADNAAEKDKAQGIQITNKSTDFTQKSQSTDNRNQDAEQKAADNAGEAAEGKEVTKINEAASKWIRVCSPLISAKWTACQKIAKDYMAIIRAHVRSYGGVDKDDKTNNRSPQKPTEYEKGANTIVGKAEREAEAAEKAANAEKEKANKNK